MTPLDELRDRVHADPSLTRRLAEVEDGQLIDAAIRVARELGLVVSADDARTAMSEARRDWHLHWLR